MLMRVRACAVVRVYPISWVAAAFRFMQINFFLTFHVAEDGARDELDQFVDDGDVLLDHDFEEFIHELVGLDINRGRVEFLVFQVGADDRVNLCVIC